MDGGRFLLILLVNSTIAFITVKVAKAYLGELAIWRTIMLVTVCLILPFFGILILLYYSIKLMFRKKN
ncbi:MAG: hypothetical protein EOM50_14030 [Erysipelotrichia bacterium]|nr:hypothetical protein [Erysipelotrichia bacterium]